MSTQPRANDRSRTHRLLAPVALTALAALLASGCKQSEESQAEETPRTAGAEVSEEVTAQASVKAVDRAARNVTLAREDGTTFVVRCGPEVVNFDQIAVGDVLRVRYLESMAVELMEPGAVEKPASTTVAADAAALGEKPSGGIGQQLTVTVRVESVDTAQNIVVFTPPDGALRTVRVVRPEGREFIKKLKPGDRVQITYTEALAISIEEK